MAQKTVAKKEAPQAPKGSAPLGHGVGRRKKSVARVWLRRGTGTLTVNDRPYDRYFDTEIAQYRARTPFDVYPHTSKYDIEVNVNGGGVIAQADAVKLGIARALLEINPDIRSILRDAGLLTVDSRVKERKKYGQRAARARFQFTKR
jgi:small subunit ribosomal protein S9